MSELTLLHAESQPLARQGLKSICFQGGGIKQIDIAENHDELLEKLAGGLPDLLVMDYQQKGYFDQSDIIEIRRKYPELKVLVISSDDDNASILKVLESGVQGFLTRQCDEAETINAIFSVSKGEKSYCNKIINILMERSFSPQEEDNCSPTSLTERETEITKLIAKGFTNKEIGEKLFLTVHTISTHRKNILKKLNVHSASALTLYAINAGIIDIAD